MRLLLLHFYLHSHSYININALYQASRQPNPPSPLNTHAKDKHLVALRYALSLASSQAIGE